MRYPSDSLQAFVSPWWTLDQKRDLRRGRLIWAFLPHVSLVPVTLIPIGRTDDPTNHNLIRYQTRPLQIHSRTPLPKLPPAAFPDIPGEVYSVYRAKKRPALIISVGGPDLRAEVYGRDKPRWQTDPTILVAPYYGALQSLQRAGFSTELVKRARRGEYPNFSWDMLPLGGSSPEGSILRFDHIQPIGRHHDSYEHTDHCLSEKAMVFIDDWIRWLFEGILPESSDLFYLREELLKLGPDSE